MNETEFNDRFLAALGEFRPWRAELVARHAWLVRERNEVMNLTRIVEPEDMARRHALDSLAAVPVLAGTDDVDVRRVLDLGTGAGFPGIPLACALPELRVTLLDSTRKKIDFLKEVVADLGLEEQVDCVWGRFEDFIRPHRKDYDLVLARAVGPLERLLGWTTNRWFGPLVLWKGPRFEEELDDAHRLLGERKMDVVLDVAYEIPGDPAERRIVVIDWK
ncbi:MAG: 16S rRNA (guanine(527)-N(7))-methyltransferase RsmG [Planctomycetes bacterium]|nr:16S rRNA (guanine(527)-N(7))-methyltransferase RsmG [Planctomycetota bacterium]